MSPNNGLQADWVWLIGAVNRWWHPYSSLHSNLIFSSTLSV